MQIIMGILILCIAVLAMSVGVMFDRKPLSGSCGGIESDGFCTICGGDKMKCEEIDVANAISGK